MTKIFRTPYFSPLNVSGCVLWFDAEDTKTMTFSGSTVTSWLSKGSSTVSTSVVSGGTNPTYTTYNNLPALGFNGTSTFIQTANVSVPGTGTTWITCSVNLTPVTASTPVDSSIVLATNAPGERAIRYSATGANTYYTINRNLTNTADLLRGQINENANGIRGFMDTASYFTGFTNGTQTVSNTNAVTYVAPANQPFLMGKWASGYLNGYIYESLVYNRVLTLEEYQQVEGYLAQKWGFTASLPANHPFLRPILYRRIVQLARLPYYKVFDPKTISSLVLWLDAADSTTVTGTSPITAWTDKSSAGRTVTITSGPTYGTTTRNGLKTMYFNNNVISSSIASAVGTGDFTLIAAWYQSSAGTNTVLSLGTVASSSQSLGYSGNKYNFYQYGSLESAYTTGPGWVVQVGTRISSIKRLYITGTIGSVPASDSFNVTDTTVTIGKGDNFAITGEIAEIMVYTGTMSDTNRQLLEGYLAQKWGLTGSLPVDHSSLTLPVGAPATGIGKQTITYLSRAPPIY